MKICIYGAGAIGGYLGAKLTEIGADVTLLHVDLTMKLYDKMD